MPPSNKTYDKTLRETLNECSHRALAITILAVCSGFGEHSRLVRTQKFALTSAAGTDLSASMQRSSSDSPVAQAGNHDSVAGWWVGGGFERASALKGQLSRTF